MKKKKAKLEKKNYFEQKKTLWIIVVIYIDLGMRKK
jgi:hypothetical protein